MNIADHLRYDLKLFSDIMTAGHLCVQQAK